MKKKHILMAGMAGALTGLAAWLIPAVRRPSPAERERRRRLAVNARGRTGAATITDFREGAVCYTYFAGGVEYTASQDVSTLTALLPADPRTLIQRPATLKYLAINPANSILVCEEWSGLRFQPHAAAPA
jgi:hypothetical protein